MIVLETFRTDGLYTATKRRFGTGGEGEGYAIGKTKLTNEQYEQLRELLSKLNNNGRTVEQQKAIDAFWKKESEKLDNQMKFIRG